MQFFYSLLILLACPVAFLAQGSEQISLIAEIEQNDKPLKLYQFDGFNLALFQTQPQAPESEAVIFKLPKTQARFYYLGYDNQKAKPFLAGSEDSLRLVGDARNITGVKVVDSEVNAAYSQLLNEIGQDKQSINQLIQAFYQSPDANKDSLLAEMRKLDQEQVDRLARMKEKDPFLGRVASLNTYLSWLNSDKDYPDEISYFANEFFAYADLFDPEFSYSPWVYQSFSQYTATLVNTGLPEESLRKILDIQLMRAESVPAVHQMAYGGVLSALRQMKHPEFAYFAKSFVEKYGESRPEAAEQLTAELENTRRLMPGAEAPDFTQATPEGEELALSELRGKVVLIDFWASWCGPCRKENPNVVRMYNKYKEKGFEILGVSLDNNRERWLGAIEKDNLTWQHVSDLKGWSNEVAQQYQVSSIPQTFLLDAEGKIIARNLRGPSLERKLEELFGNP